MAGAETTRCRLRPLVHEVSRGRVLPGDVAVHAARTSHKPVRDAHGLFHRGPEERVERLNLPRRHVRREHRRGSEVAGPNVERALPAVSAKIPMPTRRPARVIRYSTRAGAPPRTARSTSPAATKICIFGARLSSGMPPRARARVLKPLGPWIRRTRRACSTHLRKRKRTGPRIPQMPGSTPAASGWKIRSPSPTISPRRPLSSDASGVVRRVGRTTRAASVSGGRARTVIVGGMHGSGSGLTSARRGQPLWDRASRASRRCTS